MLVLLDLIVRELSEQDLNEADRILRLAFGTHLGLQDPMQMFGDRDMISNRRKSSCSEVLGAFLDRHLVGTNVITKWGSFGWFGPLTIRPDLWDRGIAKKLMESTMEQFVKWKTTHEGLFTFANSQKHVGLYQKFGFYPRFLTAIMTKKAKWISQKVDAERLEKFSGLATDKKIENALSECKELSNSIFVGLDLSGEIRAVHGLNLGDTIVVRDSSRISAFAICHVGPKTEAGSGNCFVKFGVADSMSSFRKLLSACEVFAFKEKSVETIEAGVNLARSEAYLEMLSMGFRTEFQGVAMQRPANEPGFNREGIFVIDDWR